MVITNPPIINSTISMDIEKPVSCEHRTEKDGSALHCNESFSKLLNMKKSAKAAMNIDASPM